MLDIKFIRENPELVAQKSLEKACRVDIPELLRLDTERRKLLGQLERLQEERNQLANELKSGGKPSPEAITKGKDLKINVASLETEFQRVEGEYLVLLKHVPNMPTLDTPVGASEEENQLQYTWGEKPVFNFAPKNHAEIGALRGWIDKERAGHVAGSRFTYLKGDLVFLQFALINFIFDTVTNEQTLASIIKEFGLTGVTPKAFVPVLPPFMLKTEVYDAMDRLEPRDQRYKIEGEDLWLEGSAEHVLGPLHTDEILANESLPIRYIGYATSFRKEAGTYGKDMEGILRLHQFDKLEMESFSRVEDSLPEHFLFIAIQEYLLRSLKLPYRKLLKCTFDIGKPNARGVDMEVWLPGQNTYRETHTADYMTDYQTRRLQTRYRGNDGKPVLAHTNDATALALGRGMIAIIENYQTADGKVTIPEILRPYLKNKTEL